METFKITIKGVEIVYNQAGEGPVILYIHGNLGSRHWFAKNMEIPGYRTVAPDMPNFGDSGGIESCSMVEYGRFLSFFLEVVAPKGTALVVGHSLGGAVALEVAFRDTEKTGKLLLVDSCPIDGLQTPEAYHPVIEKYKTDRNLLATSLQTVVPSLKEPAVLEVLVDEALKMKGDCFIGHAVELGKVDYREQAAQFEGDVLVVRGSQDGLITKEMGITLAESFRKGEYREFSNVGHSVMLEDSELFNMTVKEFLK